MFRPDPKPEKKIKVKKAYIYKRKPTGEKDLFTKIWDDRGPYSEISDTYLGEFNICFFAHILAKGQNKYPHFKLREDNICLMTFEEHTTWDGDRTKCIGPKWEWLFHKEAELKEEYNLLYKK